MSSKTDQIVIHSTNRRERWRYLCPNGHTNWQPTNGGIWCQQCSRQHDIDDPHWHALVDQKTDELVPWEHIDFR